MRGYLGMGVSELKVLRQSEQNDIVPALSAFLNATPSSVILCGSRAELGESSGLVPYQLADALGYTLVANVAVIEKVAASQAVVLQALPRGQRRRIEVALPAILAVDSASPVARQSAYAKATRGFINCVVSDTEEKDATNEWHYAPARKRPKRLKIIKATSARDRFKAAAAKAEGAGGQVLTSVTAEEGAAAILKVLKEEGVLKT
ncbi:electron transfer flavoprotein subunit beta [Nitrincola nitratireducens]|uniref:electron transfer flavoprotein subunit beta n=1 Tax=Nitrincola nitratireducens TaxID=1229521 RepID=UPI00307B63B8